ncbi:hypothetical protein VTL71DRAFT_15144 [Oculimacula yallundae]|uniref:Uncharacterized protein n=1 Tax=Oculimacula yallundae TaxID=86028 RepID=A0ABR4CHT2_9HELO
MVSTPQKHGRMPSKPRDRPQQITSGFLLPLLVLCQARALSRVPGVWDLKGRDWVFDRASSSASSEGEPRKRDDRAPHRDLLEKARRDKDRRRRGSEAGSSHRGGSSTFDNPNLIPTGPSRTSTSRARSSTYFRPYTASTSQSLGWQNSIAVAKSEPAQYIPSLSSSTPTGASRGEADEGPSTMMQIKASRTPSQTKSQEMEVNGSGKRGMESRTSSDAGSDVQPIRKKIRHAANLENDNHIGQYADNPSVNVYAKIKPQVSSLGAPPIDLYIIEKARLSASTQLVTAPHAVTIIPPSKVQLSSTIFVSYANALEKLSGDKKIGLIRQYLQSLEKENEPMADEEAKPEPEPELEPELDVASDLEMDEAEEQKEGKKDDNDDEDTDDASVWGATPVKIRYVPESLQVGWHRDDTLVPVKALARLFGSSIKPTVQFQIIEGKESEDSEMDFSRITVKPEKVLFNPEFNGPTIAGSKAKILARFTKQVVAVERRHNESPTPSKGSRSAASNAASASRVADEDYSTVSPHPPTPAHSVPAQDLPTTIEAAIAALRNAENHLLASDHVLGEKKAELEKQKLEAKARDISIDRKVEAHLELERRLKLQQEAVQKRETDLRTWENSLKSLEKQTAAREKALSEQENAMKDSTDFKEREKKLREKEDELKAWEEQNRKHEESFRERRKVLKGLEANSKTTTSDLEIREKSLAVKEKSWKAKEKSLTTKEAALISLENSLIPKVAAATTRETDVTERETRVAKKEAAVSRQQPTQLPALRFSLTIPKLFRAGNEVIPSLTKLKEHFYMLPQDDPNAGFYARREEHSTQVHLQYKGCTTYFTTHQYLKEVTNEMNPVLDPKIEISGSILPGTIPYGKLKLVVYEKDDGFSTLVQEFGNESLYRVDTHYFVSWYVYKQVNNKL